MKKTVNSVNAKSEKDMPTLSQEQWCYLAGLFDGEGCISIVKHPDGEWYRLQVVIGMTHKPTIERVSEWTGRPFSFDRPKPGRKQGYRVQFYGLSAKELLQGLLSSGLLLTKQEHARLGIEFAEKYGVGYRSTLNESRGRKHIPNSLLDFAIECRGKMLKLTGRGIAKVQRSSREGVGMDSEAPSTSHEVKI